MDAVEDIKSRLAIEDVVGEYIQLKRSGSNYKGLSPFTNEKTASFMVSPEKQIWHDFSSGKGGNVFSFVMEMEGLDFKGALELLAGKAGIDLSDYRSGQSADYSRKKARDLEVMEIATKFYQVQFSQNKEVLDYVINRRKFNKQTALEFKLGYSPNTGDALIKYLKSKSISEAEIKRVGLSATRHNGIGDMFRGRLMIPLCDSQGRVIGFTARQLIDEPNSPKYINTPKTMLYDKSRHVFGLHQAKESIRKDKFAVMVEGNLDVIASHQAGVKNVVATAGTALTEHQLKELKRLSGDIRLAFDQDRAGLNAAERAIPIADKVKVEVSIITIPQGKDPDELISQDPKLWVDTIENRQPTIDWLIDRYQLQLDLDTAAGKKQFSDVVLNVVTKLDDAVEKEHYINKIAGIVGVSTESLLSKMSGTSIDYKTPKKRPKVEAQLDKDSIDQNKTQDQLLCIMLMRPSLRDGLKVISEEMIVGDDPLFLFNYLTQNPEFSGQPSELGELKQIGDYVRVLTLQYETLYQSLDIVELEYESQSLQARLVNRYVKNLKHKYSEMLKTSDSKNTDRILEKAKKLDQLLKSLKGA